MSLDGEFRGTARYEVVSRLGEGGMGTVYAALDRERGERVALKTVRSAAPHALVALKREFRAAQGLAHPNLVRLDGLFEDEGRWLS